ncbi:MAG TPA: peptidylprolyl isomerase [Holophaga sp.]|nr:peptidylprolyl isomerase [Holophaga sp.]
MRTLMAAVLLACLPMMGANAKPKVKITTNLGAFTLQLEPEAAPKTVENFMGLVRKGFYNGTIFHRIAKYPAIVQGGGYTAPGRQRMTNASVTNEGDLAKSKGLHNRRGTVAMAYSPGNPLGAKSQFFINVKDNLALDFKTKTMTGYGFCPFAKVVQGLEIVDKIAKAKTKPGQEIPVDAITILKAEETN